MHKYGDVAYAIIIILVPPYEVGIQKNKTAPLQALFPSLDMDNKIISILAATSR